MPRPQINHAICMTSVVLLPVLTAPAQAAGTQECVAETLRQAEPSLSIGDIRRQCGELSSETGTTAFDKMKDCLTLRGTSARDNRTAGSIREECTRLIEGRHIPERMLASKSAENNPYVLTPHRQNYILPWTHNEFPNQAPYRLSGDDDLVQHSEAKFQVSIKAPMTTQDLLLNNDALYFAFTLKSFWQVYNDEISAPFRETNYRPEVFYQMPLPIASASGAWFGRVGLEHESNGRTQVLSRSWNRSYVTLGFIDDHWTVSLQPWYRLPEDEKEADDGNPDTPPPSKGDDNPDIDDYLGYYELNGAYKWGDLELSAMHRRNWDEGRGAHELGLSFPLHGRLKGYVQYFEGYGESMIDYNHKNRRIGLGVLLTDWL